MSLVITKLKLLTVIYENEDKEIKKKLTITQYIYNAHNSNSLIVQLQVFSFFYCNNVIWRDNVVWAYKQARGIKVFNFGDSVRAEVSINAVIRTSVLYKTGDEGW